MVMIFGSVGIDLRPFLLQNIAKSLKSQKKLPDEEILCGGGIKNKFLAREQQKITYTPIIFEAIIKAIIDFPLINISVDNEHIIKHKNIHIGMATALKNGNLIVPVIKNAQEKNILGLTKSVNDLAKRARENQLKPDEITGGTFTVTNVGSFGSIMGTPIINQPQVAILALGKIQKKATVIETDYGDSIGIRSKMFLSLWEKSVSI